MDFKSILKQKRVVNITVIVAFIVAIVLVLTYGFNGSKSVETVAIKDLFNDEDGLIVQGVIETKEVNINSKIPGKLITLM